MLHPLYNCILHPLHVVYNYMECLGQQIKRAKGAFASERDNLSEAVVSLRTVVTSVTWLISRTEFSNSELVL